MRKKIFLIISSIQKGGTQKNIIDLFNYWKRIGHNIKIITFDKKIKYLNKKIKNNVIDLALQKKSKNVFYSIFNNLERIYKLRTIIKKNQRNHIFSFISTTNILAVIANFGLKNNLIISERNDPELQNISKVWTILRKIFYRYANKVTANSKKACNFLERFVSKKKIFFIPNHIFLNQKKTKSKKKKIILAIGRLHYQKGFDVLIDSFYLSKVYKNGWKLVILGEGSEEKFLKNKVKKLKLNNKILFKGFVDPTIWYKKSKIFVLPSRFEGTPNVLLEAISMGLPTIITNNCKGAMYYLKNNFSTLVVPAENSQALSKTIIKLIYNENLQKKIDKEAFKKISVLADYKKIFKKWDFFLKEI